MTFPDVDSLSTYGGALSDLGPVQDPTTDRGAASMNQALETVAQVSHCAPRALCRITFDSTTPVMGFNDAGWGSLAPPAITRAALGTFDVTWPSTVLDALGASHVVQLRWALIRCESSGSFPGFAFTFMRSANVVRVYTFNTSFAANDVAGQSAILVVG